MVKDPIRFIYGRSSRSLLRKRGILPVAANLFTIDLVWVRCGSFDLLTAASTRQVVGGAVTAWASAWFAAFLLHRIAVGSRLWCFSVRRTYGK